MASKPSPISRLEFKACTIWDMSTRKRGVVTRVLEADWTAAICAYDPCNGKLSIDEYGEVLGRSADGDVCYVYLSQSIRGWRFVALLGILVHIAPQ
jgi:hypothetical protein